MLVAATTYLTPKAVRVLEERKATVEWPEKSINIYKWLEERAPSIDILLLGMNARLEKKHIEEMEKLKLIIAMSSGVDHIDVEAAAERGVCVANQPEAIAESVAEHTLGLILASLRRIVEGHHYVASGEWFEERKFLSGRSMRGKTLGIVGLGRIGALVALYAKSLGVSRILYWSRRRKRELEQVLKAEPASLQRLFRESDIVVVALPDTPQTRGIIDYTLLSSMKEAALLVNIGRGKTVDSKALERILKEKKDIRIALDVYPEEPLPKNSSLLKTPREDRKRLVLTPHHAGGTKESMEATRYLAALQAAHFIERREVWNPVAGPCKEARDIPGLWGFLSE